ncbi:MAG TPA: type II secretion system F family protein [Planctomycetota bacterium]|nr:type II secretion system F family protein [Planctomycetota bacterium]
MTLLIILISINAAFLAFLQFAYVAVTRRRLKIALLVEHLATLARNGMPIHSGLRAIARDLGGYLGTRVQRVAQGLEEGRTLGEAFDLAPRSFPPLMRSMLSLGEKSGNLMGFLEEMRRSYRRLSELPFQGLYLFLYPLLLSVGINAALAGLYAGIVPKFGSIFLQMGMNPETMMAWWPRLILANECVLVLCVWTVVFMVMGGTSSFYGVSLFRGLKRAVERSLLAVPLFGGLIRDGGIQQFAMSAGLFLRSGASLPEALGTAAEVQRNGILREQMGRVARAVSEGVGFPQALRREGIGEDFLWFVETGEASGLLDEHLLLAAAHYQTKVRIAARLASRAVLPTFVILNGLVVAGTFLLIFLPIQEVVKFTVEKAR